MEEQLMEEAAILHQEDTDLEVLDAESADDVQIEEAAETEDVQEVETADEAEDLQEAEIAVDAEEPTEKSTATVPDESVPEEEAQTAYVPTLPNLTKVGPIIRQAVPAAKKMMMKAPALRAEPTPTPPVVLDKTATLSADGKNVEIKLESYVTGSSIISEETVPVDVVLVLDLSTSMDQSFGDGTRLEALKSAVNNFLDKIKADNPDSRVAIVQFRGSALYVTNTETVTPNHLDAANAMKPIDYYTKTGDSYDAVSVMDKYGADGTKTDEGMVMARNILAARSDTSRPCAVIMFTDGAPDNLKPPGDPLEFQSGWRYANKATAAAYELKNNSGATVYSVATISYATGNPDATGTAIDTFLNSVSSNYPNATANGNSNTTPAVLGDKNPNLKEGQTYYTVVDSPEALDSIFQSIAQEIGGSSVTLTGDSVVNDIVTPYFTLPEGATGVELKTSAFEGEEGWGPLQDASGVTATLDGNKLHVTGFNYSDNWVGYTTQTDSSKTPRGEKLVITFTVPVKPLYLGGSVTKTNGADSGLYENASATEPVKLYDVPDVNVPLKAVTPKMDDKHVYLTQDANVVSGLITGSTSFTIGEGTSAQTASFSELFDGVNNANVDVSFTLKDENGNVLGTYTVEHGATSGSWSWIGDTQPDLTDNKYTLSSCVQDIADASNKKEVAVAMNIFIYKPEMTFKDQSKYYGEDITYPRPTDIVWKCGDKVADPAVMEGNEPSLGITQKPKETNSTVKANDTEYVAVTSDFPVSVSIAVGGKDMTGLLFSEGKIKRSCDADSSHTATTASETFVVHVDTLSLTVNKHVDGLFANKSRTFEFEVTFRHPALSIDAQTFSLGDNGTKTLENLPMGVTVTINETNVPSNYTVMMNEEEGNPQDFTLNEDLTVEVQNVLDSIPVTGVVAGRGPELLLGLFAAITLVGFITLKTKSRRRSRG